MRLWSLRVWLWYDVQQIWLNLDASSENCEWTDRQTRWSQYFAPLLGWSRSCTYRFPHPRRTFLERIGSFDFALTSIESAQAFQRCWYKRTADIKCKQQNIIKHMHWVSSGFTSHSTQNWSFQRHSSRPISWLSTKTPQQTQQKQTCIRNKICYNITWTQKTKARFGRLLRPLAWKQIGPILVSALHKFITTYLLRHLPAYLQPRDPHGAVPE